MTASSQASRVCKTHSRERTLPGPPAPASRAGLHDPPALACRRDLQRRSLPGRDRGIFRERRRVKPAHGLSLAFLMGYLRAVSPARARHRSVPGAYRCAARLNATAAADPLSILQFRFSSASLHTRPSKPYACIPAKRSKILAALPAAGEAPVSATRTCLRVNARTAVIVGAMRVLNVSAER